MVVFTSGIVDAGLSWMSVPVGVDVWGGSVLMALRWWGVGSDTLLGPEGSAVGLVSSGALLCPVCAWLRAWGVGGVVV